MARFYPLVGWPSESPRALGSSVNCLPMHSMPCVAHAIAFFVHNVMSIFSSALDFYLPLYEGPLMVNNFHFCLGTATLL